MRQYGMARKSVTAERLLFPFKLLSVPEEPIISHIRECPSEQRVVSERCSGTTLVA